MRQDPNTPRTPRQDEQGGPMKRKEGGNRPGQNPEREDEGGFEEER
jgi:hypothetical protein